MTTLSLTRPSAKQAFYNALQIAQQYSYGFAAWKVPGSTHQTCCIGKVEATKSNKIGKSSGFLFRPYDGALCGHLIHSTLTLSVSSGQLKYKSTEQSLLEKLENINTTDTSYYVNNRPTIATTDKSQFCNYVSSSVEAIKRGEFQKVVPARSLQVDLSDQFDLVENFNKLCEAYPNAFVSIVSIPNIGTWMGATPEVLISVDQSRFQTVSLAGTQKYDPALPLSEVAWTQKEIEEQAMVSRYIINCFKKIRLREFEEAGPKTVKAGNLIHLKTTFSVDMKTTKTPELGDTMLELLHPTSAVCGMPKEKAAAYIKTYENGYRDFFSGYLGPVNFQDATQLFVNLRCMQLLDSSAILYAGAGVTEDSIPEKEWLETELKMNTLLNIIKL